MENTKPLNFSYNNRFLAPWDPSQKKTHKISNTIGHRYTVYTLFMKKYHGLYPPSDDLYKFWIGRGGIASKIKRDMGMPRTFSSRRLLLIFEKAVECYRNGDKFDPMKMESRCGHRKMTIRIGSLQAQMIANHIESGLSIQRTCEFINHYQYENNEELISISCVVWTIRKMKPKIVPVKSRKQGSNDPDSSWSQARYAWSCQLLARFGRLQT